MPIRGKIMFRKRAMVVEWVGCAQLKCPYCNAVQTSTNEYHVFHNPPAKWKCERCGKNMKVHTIGLKVKNTIKRILARLCF